MALEPSKGWQQAGANWRVFVIAVAVLVVAFNVGSPNSLPSFSSDTVVQLDSTWQLHQHLDNDAGLWLPPVLPVWSLEICSENSHCALTRPATSHLLIDESLSNRPPPSC